jgi:hypothetical protein
MAVEGLQAGQAVLKRLLAAAACLGHGLAAVLSAPTFAADDPTLPPVEVFVPTPCLACIDWADHLRAKGFRVTVTPSADLAAVKRRLGVPPDLESRHTSSVAGYFVEGHVPVDDILDLLKEKPKARGIAVPGLPRGAPGLELSNPSCETACTMLDNDSGVRDIRRELFDTLLVLPDGRTKTWARH